LRGSYAKTNEKVPSEGPQGMLNLMSARGNRGLAGEAAEIRNRIGNPGWASPIHGNSEMARLIRQKDWSATPLGPVEGWSQMLVGALNIALASPFPTNITWGDELTLLYNDAYRPFLTTKHPASLGQSFRRVFEEAWPAVQQLFEAALYEGTTSFEESLLVPIERNGKLENVYWLYSLSPVYDGGRIAGVQNVAQDVTRTVMAERQLRSNLEKQSLLLRLSQGQRQIEDPRGMMRAAAEAVGKHLHADRVGFLEHRPDAGFEITASWVAGGAKFGPLTGVMPLSSLDGQYLDEWAQGKTVTVADTEGDQYSQGSSVVAAGVRARIGVPVLRNGRWVAGFFVHTVEPRQWSDDEVSLARDVAEHTWDAVERACTARALQYTDRRARRVLESIGDAVIVTDKDALITRMNPVAENLTGWIEGEAIGQPLPNVFRIADETTRAPMESPVDKIKRLGTVVGFAGHTVLYRRDGTQVHIDDSGAPVREDDGQLSGVVLVFRDVSEKREADRERERLLREVQSRYAELEATYETSGIALALIDAKELRYLRVNRMLCEILGQPREKVLGARVDEVAAGVEGLQAALEAVKRGETVSGGLLVGELATSPGEKRYFTADYSPVLDAEGNVVAIAAASAEITHQKKAEAALMQSEKLAAVGRLAASIAHEINNPLESVTNLLYLARETQSIQEAHEYLDIAERELRRASVITNQTLRFHRQSTGPREMRCDELLESVLVIYHGRFVNSRISVEKQTLATRGVLCFDGEVRQVLSNLVSNAIDAMHPIGGRLLVRSREGRDWSSGRPGLVLTIADTGPGMLPAIAARAFEPFYTTKGIGGTGLGLWISKDIVARHGGQLRMRTSHGGCAGRNSGTVFTLFLPFEAELR
jgi:PAS domain S-box-containing protein